MRYHITQSLLSAWLYIYKSYDPEEKLQEFIQTLNREKIEPTEAMLNGCAFENQVYSAASGGSISGEWSNGVRTLSDILKGAQFQVKIGKNLSVRGMDFNLVGVLDALKEGTIFDVKFCSKSFHSADLAGKYLDSPQHPAYFYLVPEAKQFVYLVSDGEDFYRECYCRADARPIADIIGEFVDFLNEMGLMGSYKEHWAMKGG